ncbi:MAG: YihY/virulence factor BrkB family protein [Chthoniobacteraceae bacterium]
MQLTQRAWPHIRRWLGTCRAVFWRACVKYDETDGEQRAASFAYYAFFAVFPLLVLIISVSAMFLKSPDMVADKIAEQLRQRLPDPEFSEHLIQTIRGVVKSRTKASLIAFVILTWSAIRFFQALVHGVNKAWGTKDYPWWRMPLKNFSMVLILASALLLGTVAPAVLNNVEFFYWRHAWEFHLDFIVVNHVFETLRYLLPPLVLFYGFTMFYKFAPRRRTLFREIWPASLLVTFGMDQLQRLFLLFTTNVTNFNAIYGTFGSIVAFLLWIYLTGTLIIFGGCFAAAQYEIRLSLSDQSESNHPY